MLRFFLHRTSLLICSLILTCTLTIQESAPQEVRVFSDEYVINFKSKAGRQDFFKNKDKGIPFQEGKAVGKKSQLIRKKEAKPERKVVVYDNQDSFCDEILRIPDIESCSPNLLMKAAITPSDCKS